MSHYHFVFTLIAYQYALYLPALGKGELNHLLGSLFLSFSVGFCIHIYNNYLDWTKAQRVVLPKANDKNDFTATSSTPS